MVQVMLRALDGHAMENFDICNKYFVLPGPENLSVLLHDPRAPTL